MSRAPVIREFVMESVGFGADEDGMALTQTVSIPGLREVLGLRRWTDNKLLLSAIVESPGRTRTRTRYTVLLVAPGVPLNFGYKAYRYLGRIEGGEEAYHAFGGGE
jgi:hypothetical protein